MKVYLIFILIIVLTLTSCQLNENLAVVDYCNQTFPDLQNYIISINTLSPGIYYNTDTDECCASVSTSRGNIRFPDYCHKLNDTQIYNLARYIEAHI